MAKQRRTDQQSASVGTFTWATKTGRPQKLYTAQLRDDSGCTTDELKMAMGDGEDVTCYAEQALPGKVRDILKLIYNYFIKKPNKPKNERTTMQLMLTFRL